MVYYISCQRGGDAEREVEKSPKKLLHNPLTSDQKYDIISRSAKSDRSEKQESSKKLKKLLPNLLTNASRYDIIFKSRVSDSKGKRKNPLTGMVLEN